MPRTPDRFVKVWQGVCYYLLFDLVLIVVSARSQARWFKCVRSSGRGKVAVEMHLRMKSFDKKPYSLRTKLASASVWAVFAMVGTWGHLTHWNFGSLVGVAAIPSSPDDVSAAANAKTEAAPRQQIKLASAEIIQQMGIELSDVEQRAMCRELTVAGRVGYEQTRIAQLTSRVSGTVWRVDKKVGEAIRRGEVLAIIDSMAGGQGQGRTAALRWPMWWPRSESTAASS